jgi:hypothetical protein
MRLSKAILNLDHSVNLPSNVGRFIVGSLTDGLLWPDELERNEGASALTSGFNNFWILALTE